MRTERNTFKGGVWQREINIRGFIQKDYTPYGGNDEFLEGPTQNITELWGQVMELSEREREANGVLDMDTKIISTIMSHGSGYLNKDRETIVGFRTNKLFKRFPQPYGGIRMAMEACQDNGYEADPEVVGFLTKHRKTHNAGASDAYTPEVRTRRSNHIVTGLPDAYGRGCIIGDYRRAAPYGVDALIQEKKEEKNFTRTIMHSDIIREHEELSKQIRALEDLEEPGRIYGFDISKPASDVKGTIQWTYLGYLTAVKEQDGATMSLGCTSTFLGIYSKRDLKGGCYTEKEIQEFMGHFIMKLRPVKSARIPEYSELFSGDPTWIMESIGGTGIDGRHMVTKISFRYLHALQNPGIALKLDLTILWPTKLPESFKRSYTKISIGSSSVQYENDDLMRVTHGDGYAIACCVSSIRIDKEMQFFGAGVNLTKYLLYVINGGVDGINGKQVGPKYRPATIEHLDFDDVTDKYKDIMEWLAKIYANVLNIIYYNHDRYCYERLQMALRDKKVTRWLTTGIVGFSVMVDPLSIIRCAKVKVVRSDKGIVTDYIVEGDFPKYGNNDDRVDELVIDLMHTFMGYIKGNHTYCGGIPTASILTVTPNMVYGNNTGAILDDRKAGQPFTPGVSPMHHRDSHGVVASLAPVAKLPLRNIQDGIPNTFSIIPGMLGKDDQIFMGDPEVELSDCGGSCKAPTFFERLDSEADTEESW